MVFDRAYVANSICTPNRCSIVTGRMPSAHGAISNGISLDWYANTFIRRLRDAGYDTALIGKAHLQDWGDLPPPFEDEVILPSESRSMTQSYPADWNRWEHRGRHMDSFIEFPGDYYGFRHVDMVIGHSDCCNGHYRHWLSQKGVKPDDLIGTMKPDSSALASFDGWWQVRKPRIPVELYPSRYIAEKSVDYLQDASRTGAPFFLQMSFPDPHHPFTPPGKYWDMYDPNEMPLPETYSDPHTSSTFLARACAERRGNLPQPVMPFGPDADQLRHALAAEYGMISLVDDCVGDVLTELERLGIADNTVVIFTSDHGDMFGDHHIILKGALHYEGCIRVPLLIADPRQEQSGRSDALVGSIDLAQTILDMADVAPYEGMHGISLAPLIAGQESGLRESLLIEDDYPNDMLRTGQPTRLRTVVTRQARLTRYVGSQVGELFDLQEDPHELENRYQYDHKRRGQLSDTLIDLMGAL